MASPATKALEQLMEKGVGRKKKKKDVEQTEDEAEPVEAEAVEEVVEA